VADYESVNEHRASGETVEGSCHSGGDLGGGEFKDRSSEIILCVRIADNSL
jgi:hypothetical protein